MPTLATLRNFGFVLAEFAVGEEWLQSAGHDDVRPKLVMQTLQATNDPNVRTVAAEPVNWLDKKKVGWYMDLVADTSDGERVTFDPDQQLGVLRFITNIPDATPCRPGASSWLYEFDYLTGSYLPLASSGTLARRTSENTLSAGARTLKLGEKTITLLTDENGKISTMQGTASASTSNAVKRVSWRELD